MATNPKQSTSSSDRKHPVNLKGHCLLCLEQQPGHIRKSQTNQTIETFQPIICYLTGVPHDNDLDALVAKNNNGENLPLSGVSKTKGLPTLCTRCHTIVADIYKLHTDLKGIQEKIQCKTVQARNLVTETTTTVVGQGRNRGSKREEFLTNMSASNMPTSQIETVCRFVQKLHQQIIDEGKKSVYFPIRCPEVEATAIGSLHSIDKQAQEVPPQPNEPSTFTQPVEPSTSATVSGFIKNVNSTALMKSGNTDIDSLQTLMDSDSNGLVREADDETLNVITVPQSTTGDCAYPASTSIIGHSNMPPPTNIRKQQYENFLDALLRDIMICPRPPSPTNEMETIETANEAETVTTRPRPRFQICDICGEKVSLSEKASHLAAHVGQEYVFSCDVCQRSYISSFRLRIVHRKYRSCSAHSTLLNDTNVMSCELCDFSSDNFTRFRNHVERHEAEAEAIEKEYICPMCPLEFSCKHGVELHLEEEHLFKPPISFKAQNCEVCNARVPIVKIRLHLLEHHSITRPLTCRLCLGAFYTVYGVLKHQIQHRRRDGCLSCHECGEEYLRFRDILTHYFQKHCPPEETKACSSCKQKFYTKMSLRMHEKKCPSRVGKNKRGSKSRKKARKVVKRSRPGIS